MNQHQSIYKTDYVPFDWMENNFSSECNDFCSSENIDECLRHISQELSALGYPSIYSSSNNCGYAVNCDIVRLLNVTFQLIGSCRDHAQIKDDLECRIRRLSSDLNVLNKKNAHLRESLEQTENKYKSVLEKERQLKEKNNHLLQTFKNEKDESKKLSSQLQQQKVTYQHEIRKYENNMNQMKARLNQIISDRNPDKKVASISPSNLLQRNSKQRGKWKTGSVAKSCVEEMYSSVISSYENRCQEMLKEISEYRYCLEQIQHQIIETDLSLGGNLEDLVNLMPLNTVWRGTDLENALEDRFKYLLNKLKETALEIANDSSRTSKEETTLLKLNSSKHEKLLERSKSCEEPFVAEEECTKDTGNELSNNFENLSLDKLKEQLETEKENLKKEKLKLTATASFIEKEKTNLAAQKLQVIKLAMQQESPSSQWHQSLNTLSSFSVITTKEGSTLVPSAKELKQCLSAPDYQIQSITPLWQAGNFVTDKEKKSKSELNVQLTKSDLPVDTSSTTDLQGIGTENKNLPKWALSAMNSSSSHPFQEISVCETSIANTTSNEELNISCVSSSEQNLELLKAAMEDIEKRRNHMSR